MRTGILLAIGICGALNAQAENPTIKELNAIKLIESGNGKRTDHALVTKGTNKGDHAGGYWGVMPITAKQAIHDNPNYFKAYKHLLTKPNSDVTAILNENRKFDALMAAFLWKKFRQGRTPQQAACSWYWGPNSYRCKNLSIVESLDYVGKFNNALQAGNP